MKLTFNAHWAETLDDDCEPIEDEIVITVHPSIVGKSPEYLLESTKVSDTAYLLGWELMSIDDTDFYWDEFLEGNEIKGAQILALLLQTYTEAELAEILEIEED